MNVEKDVSGNVNKFPIHFYFISQKILEQKGVINILFKLKQL